MKKALLERKCLGCNKLLNIGAKYPNKKYCNASCRAAYCKNKKRFGGIRLLILERDNYSCVSCGSKERLEVHHKDGSGSYKSPNNSFDNLETLCNKCHKDENNLVNPKFINITKDIILNAIKTTKTRKEAADKLGITYITYQHKCKVLGIKLDDVEKICTSCGSKFTAKSTHHYTMYCSVECKKKSDVQRRKHKLEQNRKVVFRNCVICGTEFEVGKYTPTKQSCSKKCAIKHQHNREKLRKQKEP